MKVVHIQQILAWPSVLDHLLRDLLPSSQLETFCYCCLRYHTWKGFVINYEYVSNDYFPWLVWYFTFHIVGLFPVAVCWYSKHVAHFLIVCSMSVFMLV